MTFEQINKGLPNPNEDDKEEKSITKSREIDKDFNLDNTKVRAIFSCDNCSAPRFFYSHKKISKNREPTTAKVKQLDMWAYGRYICGNEVPIEGFFMMQKLRFGNYVESQY